MIKTFNKPDRRVLLNLIKGIHEQPTANISLNGGGLNASLPKTIYSHHFYSALYWRS